MEEKDVEDPCEEERKTAEALPGFMRSYSWRGVMLLLLLLADTVSVWLASSGFVRDVPRLDR